MKLVWSCLQYSWIKRHTHVIPHASFVPFVINIFSNENLYRFYFHKRFTDIPTWHPYYIPPLKLPSTYKDEVCHHNRCLFHVSTHTSKQHLHTYIYTIIKLRVVVVLMFLSIVLHILVILRICVRLFFINKMLFFITPPSEIVFLAKSSNRKYAKRTSIKLGSNFRPNAWWHKPPFSVRKENKSKANSWRLFSFSLLGVYMSK